MTLPVSPDASRPTRIHGTLRTNLLSTALAVGLIATLTFALHWRVQAAADPQSPDPLPVEITTYTKQGSYERQVSFLGLVQAGRIASLGFEQPGLLATLAVREGDRVVAGELLASLDDQSLLAQRRGAAADLERVRSELQLARLKADRQRDLSDTGAVSKEAYDETRLRAQALEAQVEAGLARVADLDIRLEKSELRAPYTGTVGQRFVDEGAVVNAGTPVLTLVDMASNEAHIGVSVDRATELDTGSNYPLTLRGREIEARLRSLRPDVDPRTRTLTAVFELPTSMPALHGEAITLRLQQTVPETGGWLPLTALLEGQRGAWTVLRLETDGDMAITVREAVEVLDTRGEMAYVRGTLESGQQVVASGLHRLTPGNVVQPLGR